MLKTQSGAFVYSVVHRSMTLKKTHTKYMLTDESEQAHHETKVTLNKNNNEKQKKGKSKNVASNTEALFGAFRGVTHSVFEMKK
jgi:hypothetical protein